MAGHGAVQVPLILAIVVIGGVILLGGNGLTGFQTVEEQPSIAPPQQEPQAPEQQQPSFGPQGIEIQQTTVSSCQTISSSGSYVLNQSITTAPTTCITITANDVSLDCQGFTIDSTDGGIAISATSRTNVTIKNCILTDWDPAILFSSTNFSRIENNTINSTATGSPDLAIWLTGTGGGNNVVTNNNLSSNDVAVQVETDSNTLSSNFGANMGQRSLDLSGANNNTFVSNNFTSIGVSAGDGIFLSSSSTDNNFTSNHFTSTVQEAIYFQATSGNNVFDSNIIGASSTWFFTNGANSGNQLINTTYTDTTGVSSARFPDNITLPSTADITGLTITSNRFGFNPSTLSFLNTSAQIIFTGLSGVSKTPTVDLTDNGTFVQCDPPRCIGISFSSGTFIFNVSSFTSYSSTEAPISSCVNITSSGSYVMNQSIFDVDPSYPPYNPCIDIQADDVVLDCQGFTIDQSDGSITSSNAVLLNGRTNVTVRNCVITDWTNSGIFLATGDSNLLENNTITKNSTSSLQSYGIFLASSDTNNVIRDNSINAIDTAVSIQEGINNTLEDNRVFNSSYGIRLISTNDSLILDNDLEDNLNYGLTLAASSGNSVSGNQITNNSAGGVFADAVATIGSDNNSFSNNNVSGNIGQGFQFQNSGNSSVVSGNTINSNTGSGVLTGTSTNNMTISNNIAMFNGQNGMRIDGFGNILTNNTVNSNLMNGFFCRACLNHNITNNTMENNTLFDFRVQDNARGNVVTNLEIGSLIIGFTGEDFALKNASAPAADPSGLTNIGKYINATSTTSGNFLFLNVSYNDTEIAGLVESSLKIAKHDGTVWITNTSAFTDGTFGVNTANNFVFANITNFSSILAPFGEEAPAEAPTGGAPAAVGAIRPDEIDPGESQTYDLGLGDTATFSTDGEVHTVRLTGVTDDTASFEVSSTPVFVTLVVGESADLDLDGNTLSDTRLTLLSTIDNSARIRVTALFEEFVPEAPAPSVPTVQPPTVAAFFAPVIATIAGQVFIAIAVIFAAIVIAFSIYDGAKRKARVQRTRTARMTRK